MTAPLRTLLEDAEARLDGAARERLAGIVEAFIANHADADLLSAEERADLARRAAEPFEAAPEAEVAAILARRG